MPALIPKGKQIHNNPSSNSVQTGTAPDHASWEASFPHSKAQCNHSQASLNLRSASHIRRSVWPSQHRRLPWLIWNENTYSQEISKLVFFLWAMNLTWAAIEVGSIAGKLQASLCWVKVGFVFFPSTVLTLHFQHGLSEKALIFTHSHWAVNDQWERPLVSKKYSHFKCHCLTEVRGIGVKGNRESWGEDTGLEQSPSHGRNLACHLFLYSSQTNNSFYIFKWLEENQKKNKILYFRVQSFIGTHHAHSFTYCLSFLHYNGKVIVGTETAWSILLEIFTPWCFTEKACCPL